MVRVLVIVVSTLLLAGVVLFAFPPGEIFPPQVQVSGYVACSLQATFADGSSGTIDCPQASFQPVTQSVFNNPSPTSAIQTLNFVPKVHLDNPSLADTYQVSSSYQFEVSRVGQPSYLTIGNFSATEQGNVAADIAPQAWQPPMGVILAAIANTEGNYSLRVAYTVVISLFKAGVPVADAAVGVSSLIADMELVESKLYVPGTGFSTTGRLDHGVCYYVATDGSGNCLKIMRLTYDANTSVLNMTLSFTSPNVPSWQPPLCPTCSPIVQFEILVGGRNALGENVAGSVGRFGSGTHTIVVNLDQICQCSWQDMGFYSYMSSGVRGPTIGALSEAQLIQLSGM